MLEPSTDSTAIPALPGDPVRWNIAQLERAMLRKSPLLSVPILKAFAELLSVQFVIVTFSVAIRRPRARLVLRQIASSAESMEQSEIRTSREQSGSIPSA